MADARTARAELDTRAEAQEALLQAKSGHPSPTGMRHQGGVSSYPEVLDVQRDLFSAEQSLVQTRLLRLLNVTDLYRAPGGVLQQ